MTSTVTSLCVTGSRSGRWGRLLRTVASWTAGVAVTLLAVAVWPQQYGGTTTVTVVSGESMEPTYHGGDLLLTRRYAYQPGDVVVYEVPADQAGAGHRVVHRPVGGDGDTGWRTQGDNNAAPDLWTPRDSDVIGGVVLHVPKLGLLLLQLRDPITWAVVGAVVVGRILWPSTQERGDAEPVTTTPAAVGGPPDLPTSGAAVRTHPAARR